jgi:hypothetical protein
MQDAKVPALVMRVAIDDECPLGPWIARHTICLALRWDGYAGEEEEGEVRVRVRTI